jgi:phage shock protein A
MFKRIGNLLHGFFGLFLSGVERQNPEALLEVEKENLRTQISRYNQGLASHAGLCENLIAQVKKLEADERDLYAKTAANLRVGNRDAAAQYALRLQTVTRELEENRVQLGKAETTYRELTHARDLSIQSARAKIESLKANLDDLKIKRATAELSEMASGMISQIGGAGDTLSRLQTMVDEERNKAAGRARVARDSINAGDLLLKESEQKALADQALADFVSKERLTITDGPASGSGTIELPARSVEPRSD